MATQQLPIIETKIGDFMVALKDALGQHVTMKDRVKLRAIILKLKDARGDSIPRDTFCIPSKVDASKEWAIVLSSGGDGSVTCDLHWNYKESSTRNLHAPGMIVLEPAVVNNPAKPDEVKETLIVDTLPILTPYEIVKLISNRHVVAGLDSRIETIKEMVDIVLKNGVGGSGTSLISPLYLYDKSSGLIIVDYSHIGALTGIVDKDYYRVSETTVALGLSPNLLDYTTGGMIELAESTKLDNQGIHHADSIDELFRVLSFSFPVTVHSSLASLKELLKKNQSTSGNWKVLGYRKPVIECGTIGYWSANNGVRVSLSKELVDEIALFNLELPLSTKGDIIIDICKNIAGDYTFDQARELINQALHSTIASDENIEIRYSNTTKNVIVKINTKKAELGSWEEVNEQVTLIYLVSEASLGIEEAPTLQSYISLPDINVKNWMKQNAPESFGVLGSLENIDIVLTRAGIFSINPFIELMSNNTVKINDVTLTVLSGYYPSIIISSPLGECYYLLTKSVLEEIYDLKRNPPMTPNLEQVKEVSQRPSEGFIKEAFKARRFQSLIRKLEEIENPEEAYDLIVNFLGDDYEQEGSVKYKDVKIKYLISYSTHNGEVKLDVSVIDIKDSRHDEPVFALMVRFKRESVHRVYESIKRLVEMSQ